MTYVTTLSFGPTHAHPPGPKARPQARPKQLGRPKPGLGWAWPKSPAQLTGLLTPPIQMSAIGGNTFAKLYLCHVGQATGLTFWLLCLSSCHQCQPTTGVFFGRIRRFLFVFLYHAGARDRGPDHCPIRGRGGVSIKDARGRHATSIRRLRFFLPC